MRIVTYNIQWGKGRDGVVDLARVARTVAEADVIALQEVERFWREMPDADEVAALARLLPDRHVAFSPSVDFHDPKAAKRRKQYGLMVLSRWPILSLRAFPLPHGRVPQAVTDPAILMECVIGHPVLTFRFCVTHLHWASPDVRLRQAKALRGILDTALAEGPPIAGDDAPDSDFGSDWMMLARADLPPMPAPAILLGDFNMTPAEAGYAALCGPVLPDGARHVADGDLVDVLRVAGMADTEGVTFPGDDAEPPVRIDHILATQDLAARVRGGWIDDAADGSDHQPVWARFDL